MGLTNQLLSLKQIRGMCGLSQEEIADSLSISREHYSRIENDSSMLRKCKIDIAIKLCDIAKITLNQINFFY